MKFLENFTIDLDKLPKYIVFDKEWTEKIDLQLAQLMLKSGDKRIKPASLVQFKGIVDKINPSTGEYSMKLEPRYKIGRR